MTREELKIRLRIDPDDLDAGLIEHPDLYYQVSEAHADAISVRDATKLDLEETKADLDKQLRATAVRDGEKPTETAFKNMLQELPKVKALERQYLEDKREADLWSALRTSYESRLKAIDRLVDINMRRWAAVAAEHGARQTRRRIADDNEARAGETRRSGE